MVNKNKAIFTFGDFRLEVAEARLLRGAEVIPLAPKTFSMLVLLVERAGELVDKDAILRSLWPDSFVEEANLTVHISALRKALATADNTQFIETVPKRGYRFTAQVTAIQEVHDLDAPAPDPVPVPEQPDRRRWLWRAAGAALLFAALLVGWAVNRNRNITTPSIAVLPFQSMSASKAEEGYLGVGIADALITRLGMLRDFNVRTTGQVRQFDRPGVDATSAAKELKVDWVLTGTVQHLDKQLRVTVQLIRAATGKTMWAEKYDEFFTNIFGVQDEISERLAQTLAPRLAVGDREVRARRFSGNPEAFRLYAEGRVEMQRLLPGSDARARELFERAVKLDPSYPQPYISLADVLVENWFQEPEHRAQHEARARECIEIVRKLDPEWPELYMASGWIAEIFDRDWAGAEAEYKHALAINPSLASAHASYGSMLNTLGRLTEAERELRRAFELNPVGDLVGLRLAWVLYEEGRFREALNLAKSVGAESSSQLYSNGISQLVALCLVHLGRADEAAQEADRVAQLSEPQPAILAELYALTGRRQQALAMIEQSKLKIRGVANPLAVAQIALGNKEEALRLLESASDRREGAVLMSGNDIDLKPLWGEARFKTLLSRMRLPTELPAAH
jgi:DNA-binding winged helix-turn-helix (wHTH) protein/TolB-like protein/Flp pilus assembly protein TadD